MPSAMPGARVRHPVQMRMLHCSWVEGGDLIVIQVGGDEGLRGEGFVHHLDVIDGDALIDHPLAVRRKIVAGGGHGDPPVAQKLQVVRDIRRAAAELAAHVGHQERDVQDVNLVGENVRFEAVLELQNRVVSH